MSDIIESEIVEVTADQTEKEVDDIINSVRNIAGPSQSIPEPDQSSEANCTLSERSLDEVRDYMLTEGLGYQSKAGFAIIYPHKNIKTSLPELRWLLQRICHRTNDIHCNIFYYFKTNDNIITERGIVVCEDCYSKTERMWETHPEGQIWFCHIHDRLHIHCMNCKKETLQECRLLTEIFEYTFPPQLIKIKTSKNAMLDKYLTSQ